MPGRLVGEEVCLVTLPSAISIPWVWACLPAQGRLAGYLGLSHCAGSAKPRMGHLSGKRWESEGVAHV